MGPLTLMESQLLISRETHKGPENRGTDCSGKRNATNRFEFGYLLKSKSFRRIFFEPVLPFYVICIKSEIRNLKSGIHLA